MVKFKFLLLVSLMFYGCENFGQLKVISDLPKDLKEVSGIETTEKSKYYWMLNDGGNKPKIYALSKKGNIKRELSIESKNHDWEDLASDDEGNLYIGDFGNNNSDRQNLRILKVKKKSLKKKKAEVTKIKFRYEDQSDFKLKKDELYFDAESFFYHNKYLYILTKSRVYNNYGLTSLYRIPAKKGDHIAKKIGTFNNGSGMASWITSADISPDGKTVALLTSRSVLLFSDYKEDKFLNGKVKKINLKHVSQKESIAFKDNKTLLIADEKSHGKKGFLYELQID